MLMNAIDLPAAVLTFILNKLVSRRRLLMCSQLVAGLSCTSMGLVTLTEAPAYVTTILCMIGKGMNEKINHEGFTSLKIF